MCDLLLVWVHVSGLCAHTHLVHMTNCCAHTPLPYFSLSLSSAPMPPSNLESVFVSKRSVSYTFSASPTTGVTYRVSFTLTTEREGIPQPTDDAPDSAGLRTKSGLTPDVDYTLQVVAVLSGVESAAVSANFTTLPGGKPILPWQLMFNG